MRCPICGHRVFLQKKWHPDMIELNFEIREKKKVKNKGRRVFNYCADCGYRLYGKDVTRLNKEVKYLEDV